VARAAGSCAIAHGHVSQPIIDGSWVHMNMVYRKYSGTPGRGMERGKQEARVQYPAKWHRRTWAQSHRGAQERHQNCPNCENWGEELAR
jgi:hypothetical protein